MRLPAVDKVSVGNSSEKECFGVLREISGLM
jgi:hypothetical protein